MIAELVSFSPLNAVCVTIARSGPGNTDFSNLVLYEDMILFILLLSSVQLLSALLMLIINSVCVAIDQ